MGSAGGHGPAEDRPDKRKGQVSVAATAHLGAQRDAVWRVFLEEPREFTPAFNAIARGTGLMEVQDD